MLRKFNFHIVMLLTLLVGCTGSQTFLTDKSLQDQLKPGLRVIYFNGMFRHVRQIPDGDRLILEKGRPGPPILMINNQFGEDEIFDSGRKRGVGVQMKGFILLDQIGSFEFQALSNDGVEIIIDGTSILIDPDVHADRMSNVGTLSVHEAGWHSIMVKYFQRKGTAALKLFWKLPEKDDFEIIPAKAYAHLLDGAKGK
jgi:hypothetical protein